MGNQTRLAEVLSSPTKKISQAHVWNWLNSTNPDKMPPAEYCPAIERATGGQVLCEDLRPDVDWAVLRGTSRDESAHEDRRPIDHEMQEVA